jgi:hypothetical protein
MRIVGLEQIIMDVSGEDDRSFLFGRNFKEEVKLVGPNF